VTSSYFSPTLERSFALALVESGEQRMGETLYATWNGKPPVPVQVTEVDFLGDREKAAIPNTAATSKKPEAEHA
jgi:sarcosine oxidase subunit alpha